MRKIWIFNHYAGDMFFNGGGRHYWFSKYLRRNGYQPTVFCSNTKHGKREKFFNTDSLWIEKKADEIDTPFVFIKSSLYDRNGKNRIKNMYTFFKNLKRTAIDYAEKNGKPDLILASSVHPLTLVAGLQVARRFNVKCICEVRDLWPESLVAYGYLKRKSIITRVLYQGEKFIYKKADKVIMTWPGGYDYICDKGWKNVIPETKVVHISNGIDFEVYSHDKIENPFVDNDLSKKEYKTFVYAGSVRKVNNLAVLVEVARKLKVMENHVARIIVFGDGDELDSLKQNASDLDNIQFKGRVSKDSIPSILSQCYASILHNSSTELNKYGQSQNKFFEYLAAGRPVLMTYSVGHSVINEYKCGIEVDTQEPEAIAQAIISLCSLPEQDYQSYCQNAAECAKKFDFKELSNQLITVINQVV